MTITQKALANGNPRCWHCLNRLVYKKGGGFKFEELVDPIGNTHRVHLDCLKPALESDPSLKRLTPPSKL